MMCLGHENANVYQYYYLASSCHQSCMLQTTLMILITYLGFNPYQNAPAISYRIIVSRRTRSYSKLEG